VRPLLRPLIVALVGLVAASARAAHTQASLILADEAACPGDTVLAGIRLRMDPQWHTYWMNSGASGIPTSVKWDLPAGISAGEIQWPVPEKLPPDDLTTYIYENEVVLLVPLKLASDLQPGPRELKATVAWLECKEQCLPGKAIVTATLTIGSDTKPSPQADLIQDWQKQLPLAGGEVAARAWWEKPLKSDERPLILEWASPAAASEADFYPQASDRFEVQGASERLPSDAGIIRVRKLMKKFEGDWPDRISGLLIQKSGDQRRGYAVTLPFSNAAEPAARAAALSQPLWKMLLYAVLGGLILNVMPCVLPVIALKILGFVAEARNDPRHVRKLGLVYTAGVLVSFLVLATIVIGVKAAGNQAGWGMQFGNPKFLVALTVVVILVALNLFGLFEVNLGGRALGAAGAIASRQGNTGAFFNGALATVLATPCTAPFLSVALGFAFAQTPAIIVLIFLGVGVGLALPYLILSCQPAWLRFLPKPGPWMLRFKILMGFPMLATGIWLFTLTTGSLGKSSTLWFGLFLVVLALAAWIWGEFVQRGTQRRGLAMTLSLLLVGGFAAPALRSPPDQIEWQPWSPRAVAEAQAEGHPVLVDFTADWCLTCQANKKIAIEIPSVRLKLKDLGAVALLGDYTHLPGDITAELTRHGRAGVPLVLVYPPKAGAPPIVLPELLTPGIVLNALDRAAK
jgi:thiol:disulfide interchange protein